MKKHILLLLLLQLAIVCRADRDTTPGWLTGLRKEILEDTLTKIAGENPDSNP